MLILNKKIYTIFDVKSKYFSFDRLKYHLSKYKILESNINGNMEYRLHFLWFRYLHNLDNKIINKYLNIPTIIVNNILGVDNITNKYLLYINLEKYFKDDMNFLPKTQLFSNETIFNNNIQILKPVKAIKTNLTMSSGKGIIICENLIQLQNAKKYLNDYDYIICQNYIKNPLLFKNKKFHIRIYMISTIINNIFNSYTIDYGRIFTSKNIFINDDYSNMMIHDTHYRYTDDDYIFPDDFLCNINKNTDNHTIENILLQIKNILYKLSVILYDFVYQQKNTLNSFHLFGIDIMIDDTFNVKLLECNKYPELTVEKNDKKREEFNNILFDLIDNIILSPVYTNKYNYTNEYNYTNNLIFTKSMKVSNNHKKIE